MYAELGLSDSDTESDEEVPLVVKSGAQEEGQAGQNPGKQDEGQAGPNPGELEQHIAYLVDANQALEERLDKHGSRLYRLENQDIPNQVSKAVDEIVMDAVDWAMHAPLRERLERESRERNKENIRLERWRVTSEMKM
ncbi:hypothetical protein Tco_0112359 [Tanacetum coccineum]